jgi:hypothetical protein
MKVRKILSSCGGFTRLRYLIVAGAAATVLSACASLDSYFRQADSSLPIEAIHSGTGQVMSFRAFETSDRLYVAGAVRGRFINPYTHVDIQLIDGSGQVIAEKQDDNDLAHPRTARGHHGRHTYVASFPLSEARQAAKVRVTYHNGSHPNNERG